MAQRVQDGEEGPALGEADALQRKGVAARNNRGGADRILGAGIANNANKADNVKAVGPKNVKGTNPSVGADSATNVEGTVGSDGTYGAENAHTEIGNLVVEEHEELDWMDCSEDEGDSNNSETYEQVTKSGELPCFHEKILLTSKHALGLDNQVRPGC